jgi:hypothetical protein
VDVSLHGRPFDASALPSPSLTDEALDINAAARGGAVEFKGGLDGLVTSMSEPQHVAWCRLFGALAGNATNALAVPAGAPVRVITLGGSMLSGVGCHDYVHPTHSPLCAYPTKLVRWLGHHYGVRVELDNLAMGGMSSGAALASLPLLLRAYESSAAARNTPTLALIDFSVNDAWEDAPTSARGRACRATPDRFYRAPRPIHPRAASAHGAYARERVPRCRRCASEPVGAGEPRRRGGVRARARAVRQRRSRGRLA